MQATDSNQATTSAQPGAASCAVRPGGFRRRPWLIGAGTLALAGALYGGWDWLAATGLATVVLAVAPCLAMCALGLCMGRGRKP